MKSTNTEFTKNDLFLSACKKANVKPTTRQASKFRNRKGAAYKIVIAGYKNIHVPQNARLDG